ncbi:MAG: tRNA (N6-isopentenyl adenosine(37)-C2)-methylthiotransferase MiaB [Bdellovibrionota bacterium]
METQTLTESQKVHIETWGCQMNVADSEKMFAMMKEAKYSMAAQPEEADLIILNTCHIREKAKHKVVSHIGRIKELKKTNPNLTIALAGCVAQAEGKKLAIEIPAIDVIIGPGKIDQLPDLVREHKAKGTKNIALGFEKIDYHNERKTKEHQSVYKNIETSLDGKNEVSRFVTIQQGCDNFCTFCVVPFTRGREISYQPQDIVNQAQQLVNNGAQEITLLGQNVNSYGQDLIKNNILPLTTNGPFVDLLATVANIKDLKRLRFTTSNPHDFTKPLAKLFAEQEKLGKYIHLPVQSGSNQILATMKRKVSVEEYYEKVSWLRKSVPDIAISTDLIVGFPGETDEDFEQTYELVKNMNYSFIFAFKYSPRKNTAAIRFKDQIDENIKSSRLQRLNQLQNKITLALNEQEVGQIRNVLFLYESKKEPGIYYGRTPHFRLVRAHSASSIIGKELPVKINGFNATALTGELNI